MTRTRWVLLVLLPIASGVWGVLLLDGEDPLYAAYWGIRGTVATWLLGGVVIWLVALAIRRRIRFRRALVAIPWLAVLLLFDAYALFNVLTRELTADERAYVTYVNKSIGCYERAQGVFALEARGAEQLAAGDWVAARTTIVSHRKLFRDLHACLTGLTDTGDPKLDAVAIGIGDAYRSRVVADDLYIAGLADPDPAVLDRADEHEQRAREEERRALRRRSALGKEHSAEINDHIDYDRLKRLGKSGPPLGDRG